MFNENQETQTPNPSQKKVERQDSSKNKKFSIRYRLMIIFGVLIASVIIILNFISITIGKKAVLEKVENHLFDKVEGVANELSTAIKGDHMYLTAVAHSPFFRSDSLSYVEKAKILEKEAEEMGFIAIYICDDKGTLYRSNGEKIDVSHREYYQKALKGESFASEPFVDALGDFCVFASVPVYDYNKRIIGVMAVEFDGFRLTTFSEHITVGETGFCYVLGKDGTAIAHPNKEMVKSQDNLIKRSKINHELKPIADYMQKALSSNKSEISFYTFKGERSIVASAKMEMTGWTVFIKAPVHEFLGTIDKLKMIIILIGITILVVALIITLIISNRLTKPIIKVSSSLKNISEGNLSKNSIIHVKSNDEIGELADAMCNMVEKLRDIVKEININAEHINNASEQVSSTSQQLSQGASEQAASTEEVSSTMEQMQANISHNTDNAKTTQQIAEKSQRGILMVKENAEQSTKASDLINEKITIINDIAFQTNILALNAAVEAARAGEHGKGFAVVAAEVRKLAERSKIAAEEIIALSASGKEVADKAGESLLSIIPEIEKTANLVEEITTASIEQNSGAEQVNNAIQQLNQVAQQNASTSEELATTSEEMTAQANKLKEAVSYFKID